MKNAIVLSLALIPLLVGCDREPQKVAVRDGWHVVDRLGLHGETLFAIQRASLTPLEGTWQNFHPMLSIEPRHDVVRGAVRIESVASHVNAAVGATVTLHVSFDDGPPEPVAFVISGMDLETTREFADRLQRHRTLTITLPGRGKLHPLGVVAYRLDSAPNSPHWMPSCASGAKELGWARRCCSPSLGNVSSRTGASVIGVWALRLVAVPRGGNYWIENDLESVSL